MRLSLRRAVPGDARRLWRWANDRVVRDASYSTAPIPWADHAAWFAGKLAEAGARVYVASAGGRPVGQLRIEANGEVGVSVARAWRGRGLAAPLIAAGCRRAARELGLKTVRAYIKADNAASIAVFRRAGFRPTGRVVRSGRSSVRLVWTPSKERSR